MNICLRRSCQKSFLFLKKNSIISISFPQNPTIGLKLIPFCECVKESRKKIQSWKLFCLTRWKPKLYVVSLSLRVRFFFQHKKQGKNLFNQLFLRFSYNFLRLFLFLFRDLSTEIMNEAIVELSDWLVDCNVNVEGFLMNWVFVRDVSILWTWLVYSGNAIS